MAWVFSVKKLHKKKPTKRQALRGQHHPRLEVLREPRSQGGSFRGSILVLHKPCHVFYCRLFNGLRNSAAKPTTGRRPARTIYGAAHNGFRTGLARRAGEGGIFRGIIAGQKKRASRPSQASEIKGVISRNITGGIMQV